MKVVGAVNCLLGLVNMASLAWRAAWTAGDRTLGNPERGLSIIWGLGLMRPGTRPGEGTAPETGGEPHT